MADRTIRGAYGTAPRVAGVPLAGDQDEVALECLLFLEPTLPNNSDASTHYISLTEQRFRRAVDVNGRLYIALSDANDHERDKIRKIVSGVGTTSSPRLSSRNVLAYTSVSLNLIKNACDRNFRLPIVQ